MFTDEVSSRVRSRIVVACLNVVPACTELFGEAMSNSPINLGDGEAFPGFLPEYELLDPVLPRGGHDKVILLVVVPGAGDGGH